jgi:hypothetical protein
MFGATSIEQMYHAGEGADATGEHMPLAGSRWSVLAGGLPKDCSVGVRGRDSKKAPQPARRIDGSAEAWTRDYKLLTGNGRTGG